MFGLSILDLAIILIYFTGMIAIGFWSRGLVKNQEDFFLGGRRFGKLVQSFAAFGQGTSVDTAVSVITTAARNGASGIWSSMLYLFTAPFYWMLAPWMRRLRTLTQADFFEERYGSKLMAAFYSVIGSIGMMALLSVGFMAMTRTIIPLVPKTTAELTSQERTELQLSRDLESLKASDYRLLTNEQKARINELEEINPRNLFSHINENVLLATVCFITIAYVLLGGLIAAFLTDIIQGILILILSVLFLPFAFAKVNSIYGDSGIVPTFKTLHQQLPQSYLELFGSPTTVDFTWYYIMAIAIMGTINVVVQPNFLVSTASAKDEYTARFGFVAGNFMKRFCIVFWGFFALIAVLLYHDKVRNPDLVWGYAAKDLLGPLNIGLVGLMIACLFAALMSKATTLMLACAGLLTRNIYCYLSPGKSVEHYLWAGRITSVLAIIGSAFLAVKFDTILEILKFVWEFNVIVAAAFWIGMKWRRANRLAAWSSMIFTFFVFFILPIIIPALFPELRTNPVLLKKTEPIQIERTYFATPMDVAQREKEMADWDALYAVDKAEGQKPQELRIGQSFEKKQIVPGEGIFWTKGIKTNLTGNRVGSGDLSVELYLLDRAGFDLSFNPYALNETLRIAIRTLTPFVILIIVAFFSRSDDKKMLDNFFAKMKTKVVLDKEQDAKELTLSYENPHRFDCNKLFPNSDWEFEKWDKEDFWGVVISILIILGIIAALKLLVTIGG